MLKKNLPVIIGGVFFLGMGAVVAFLAATQGPGSGNDTGDPVLEQLARSNPDMQVTSRLEDRSNRVPTFWVRQKNGGPEVLMPRSLADDGKASLTFMPCESVPIPARLLPPNISMPVCVLIKDHAHALNAFFFSTKGRISDMVEFYDGPRKPGENRRLPFAWQEESLRQAQLPDGTITPFSYSYYLYGYGTGTDFSVAALVGYKRESVSSN